MLVVLGTTHCGNFFNQVKDNFGSVSQYGSRYGSSSGSVSSSDYAGGVNNVAHIRSNLKPFDIKSK